LAVEAPPQPATATAAIKAVPRATARTRLLEMGIVVGPFSLVGDGWMC
jgi:hypothetical protein